MFRQHTISCKVVLGGASRGMAISPPRGAGRRDFIALAPVGGLEDLDDGFGRAAARRPLCRRPAHARVMMRSAGHSFERLAARRPFAMRCPRPQPVALWNQESKRSPLTSRPTMAIRSIDLLLASRRPAGRFSSPRLRAFRLRDWGCIQRRGALEAWKSYAAELGQARGHVFSPGAARTAMRAQAMRAEPEPRRSGECTCARRHDHARLHPDAHDL